MEEKVDPTPSITINQFAAIQLRVGLIESADPVEKSKKLLKLSVFLGDEIGRRQILSGISQFYTPETLIGKRVVVVVANLAPATMMGLESQGMILAVINQTGDALSVLEVGEPFSPGSIVR